MQPCCQVNVRAKVCCVNLVLRANSAFYCPTTVQPKIHAHSKIWQTLEKLRMMPVFFKYWRSHHVSHHLYDSHERHVCQFLLLFVWMFPATPGQQKSTAQIFARASKEFFAACMHKACNAIDEDQHFIPQHLRDSREMLNITEAEHGLHLPAWKHGVERGATVSLHGLADYFSTCLPKTEGQQRADLDDRLLQNCRFHWLRQASGATSKPAAPPLHKAPPHTCAGASGTQRNAGVGSGQINSLSC
mmetsp:Transcript_28416/g.55674  ORF Transcript_28416/g.55674 Transcript_28416/m.55674 type:complete len:245 (+) Transcript_28416:608-1342(+)